MWVTGVKEEGHGLSGRSNAAFGVPTPPRNHFKTCDLWGGESQHRLLSSTLGRSIGKNLVRCCAFHSSHIFLPRSFWLFSPHHFFLFSPSSCYCSHVSSTSLHLLYSLLSLVLLSLHLHCPSLPHSYPTVSVLSPAQGLASPSPYLISQYCWGYFLFWSSSLCLIMALSSS